MTFSLDLANRLAENLTTETATRDRALKLLGG